MPDARTIRHSIIAGQWYPGEPRQLRAMMDGFVAAVDTEPLQGELVGLIVPHAGYMYSGQVAAYAYAQLKGRQFKRVVVVSPVHRMYVGTLAVTDKAYYETPLGLVPVNREMVQALSVRQRINCVGEDMEHSLEIQLPFLQHTLGELSLTPIMMGDQDKQSAAELGVALAEVIGTEPVLLIASTDLSHFHPYEAAVHLDQEIVRHIVALDAEGLAHAVETDRGEACGAGPVMAVMIAALRLKADRAVLLKYMNSGDVTGDQSSVVGYAAAALMRS